MIPNPKGQRDTTSILSNTGFTLIELLIAMAIASILLTAAVSVYTALTRSYTTESVRASAQQDLRSAMALMTQDIRIARLDPLGAAVGGITLTSSTDIQVVADLDYDGILDSGEQIRYFLNGTNLMQRQDSDATTDAVLMGNVNFLSFTVTFDADGITPLMVNISMTIAAPAGRSGTVTRTLTERVRIRNQ